MVFTVMGSVVTDFGVTGSALASAFVGVYDEESRK
jgi:hypothetical protein